MAVQFEVDPIKSYFLGTVWERPWSLREVQARDMNHMIGADGGLIDGLQPGTAQILFEAMVEGDAVNTRIHASMWLLSGKSKGCNTRH